ncbi:GNAT family N-acetyltransferase [Leptolyngbya ohadii]|uniref:GNAT family N-acetyltransferase n=1 Tax=Leptolyngbya ohadii TaxID=1962290 RepID=UPI000B59A5F1|nr:GNAT family N-acetyltransferase [Leptolyngbya ohadii]
MTIELVRKEQLAELAVLFNQYRIFYKQSSDLKAAKQFLEERFQRQDSIILVAKDGDRSTLPPKADRLIGFTQLYPSFSSVSLKRIWILNDLYVAESARHRGVAQRLMVAAEKHARLTCAVRIVLSTQMTNTIAQKLYESRGYIKDTEFLHYALPLSP